MYIIKVKSFTPIEILTIVELFSIIIILTVRVVAVLQKKIKKIYI